MTSPKFLLIVSIYAVVFLIGALITRAIFSIPTIVRNLKMQTLILEEIAKRNGVDPYLLDEINNSV